MNDTVLATIPDESRDRLQEITIRQYNTMLTANPPDKHAIAEMIYHRFFGRYIKPFLFDDRRYKTFYKSGFAMMASSCLLIEALESFYEGLEETPVRENEKMFKSFFDREEAFRVFGGTGFYKHVRCGILHQGETTGGFTIERTQTGKLFDSGKKRINALVFLAGLEGSLASYRKLLLKSEWDSEVWDNFRRKMRFIINHCST
jgi:hypothetical protein